MQPGSDLGGAPGAGHGLVRTADSAPNVDFGTLHYASPAGDQVAIWRSTIASHRLVLKITNTAGEQRYQRADTLDEALRIAGLELGLAPIAEAFDMPAGPAPPSAA